MQEYEKGLTFQKNKNSLPDYLELEVLSVQQHERAEVEFSLKV